MTPPGSYAKGVRGEKKSRRYLESIGYYVIEARGSHGAVDLVATSIHHVRYIQVKSGRALGKAELEKVRVALRRVPVPDNGVREIHQWFDYDRAPHVEVVE